MQDYKSPCAAVIICATSVNIKTHTQMALWPPYMNSSSSWAKNNHQWQHATIKNWQTV